MAGSLSTSLLSIILTVVFFDSFHSLPSLLMCYFRWSTVKFEQQLGFPCKKACAYVSYSLSVIGAQMSEARHVSALG